MVLAAIENGVFFSLYGILIAGLLGVYGLGFKIMKDVNAKIDGHVTNTGLHVDSEHPLRTVEVCMEREKTISVQFITLKDGQGRIEKGIDRLWERLDELKK